MASIIDIKKLRAKQFSFRETEVLKEMMEIKYEELNAKRQNGKQHCDRIWQEITDAVNAVGTCPRTVHQVKEKWRNMMKKAKADYSAERVSLGKTGGGPAPPEMSQTSKGIVEFMKDLASFSGIPGASGSETLLASKLGTGQADALATEDMDAENAGENSLILWTVNETDEILVDNLQGVVEVDQATGTSVVSQSGNRDMSRKEPQKRAETQGKQAVHQSKPQTLKSLQTEYYRQAIENQRTQMECFEKLSKLADIMIKKFSSD